ncbi:hypothetical protein [Ralstonia solanacearum]|uniref:hypothetical protein n=1 Tax=Ralstonia solanacearum TaxID=305 RepID=UPI0013DE1BEA|nr:hypothetical protein [Ralstonia solanacearum]
MKRYLPYWSYYAHQGMVSALTILESRGDSPRSRWRKYWGVRLRVLAPWRRAGISQP